MRQLLAVLWGAVSDVIVTMSLAPSGGLGRLSCPSSAPRSEEMLEEYIFFLANET